MYLVTPPSRLTIRGRALIQNNPMRNAVHSERYYAHESPKYTCFTSDAVPAWWTLIDHLRLWWRQGRINRW